MGPGLTTSAYLFAFSLVKSPALRLWGHSSGQRWPFRPLESRTKKEPASPKIDRYLHFRLQPFHWYVQINSKDYLFLSHMLKQYISYTHSVISGVQCTKLEPVIFIYFFIPSCIMAACEHTLNCYSWFPEHIWVFQQLLLIPVDSDDLTASVKNSAVAQPEVTHGACKHNTQ